MRKDPAERLRELTRIDGELWALGVPVAGIDEAGRGPLAGPVTAGCVVLPPEPLIPGIDDSKKLSEKKREELYDRIVGTALYARTGWASVEEIEALNILGAARLAMERAAEGAPAGTVFLVDAVQGLRLPGEIRPIIHGDRLSYAIAAASILAKVERDRYMRRLDAEYPGYGFAGHKGYGTAAHIAALKALGPCPQHRPSFIGHFVPGREP